VTDREKAFVDKLLDAGLRRYSAVEAPDGLEDRLLPVLRAAETKDSVDRLLDAGLARYSAAETRPGLENRILAGLSRSAGPQPSRWLDWRWAGALTTAAVALLVLAVFFLRQPPAPPKPSQTATSRPAPVAPAPAVSTPPVAQPLAVPKRTTRRAQPQVQQARAEAPRLETFPAPAPLSEQERLLLLFTRQAPQEAALTAQARSRPTEPLGIAPLPQIEEMMKKPEVNNN
jgi:hypothetical protein